MQINIGKIKRNFNKLLNSDFFWLWVILSLFIIFCGNFFFDFLFYQTSVGGWDGTSHFALSVQYAEKIFPDPFGWIHNWYAGMPWPMGYPPFFYYVISVLYKVLPFENLFTFKLFVSSIAFAIPFLSYFVAKKFTYSKFAAGVAASVISFILFSDNYALLNDSGITIRSTFNVGLYPQLFGLFLLLLWLLMFLSQTKRVRIASIIIFALIFLTNIHVAQAATITFGAFVLSKLIITKHFRTIYKHILYFSIALLTISFWVVTLFSVLNFFPSKILSSYPIFQKVPFTTIPILFIAFVSLAFAYRRKDHRMLGMSLAGFFILLASVIPWSGLGLSIPLQPFRFFPISMIFVSFSIPFTLNNMASKFSQPLLIKIILMCVILAPLLTFTKPLSIFTSQSPVLFTDDQKLIEYLKQKTDGRSFIEYFSFTPPPTHEAISSGVGTGGDHQTLWTVFRESSLSSYFIVPMRNSMSTFEENYALDCFLCTDPYKKNPVNEFYDQGLEEDLKRAELYNVKYFAVRTQDMIKEFNANKELRLVEKFGYWQIYEYKNSGFAEGLNNEPILTFSNLTTKNRSAGGLTSYDWARINEELLFNEDRSVVLAHAKNLDLSTSNDFEKFKYALITQIYYSDLEKAVERIKNYVEDNHLYIFRDAANAELVEQLINLNSPNIFIINKTGKVRDDVKTFVEKHRENIEYQENEVLETTFGKNKIDIQNPNNIEKIYLKVSYFPYWEDYSGGEIYLASPSSMLILPTSDKTELYFDYSTQFNIGLTLTILGLVIVLILFISRGNIEYSMLKFWHGNKKPITKHSKKPSRKVGSKDRRSSDRKTS